MSRRVIESSGGMECIESVDDIAVVEERHQLYYARFETQGQHIHSIPLEFVLEHCVASRKRGKRTNER